MAHTYYYYPDIGDQRNEQLRLLADDVRGELVFPIFSDEEKAREFVANATVHTVWRRTWKQCQAVAKRNNCVGMIVDAPEEDEHGNRPGLRDQVQYLENPNQAAHHYLKPEMRRG